MSLTISEKKMTKRSALTYLKLLFEEEDSKVIVCKGESQIDAIFKSKVAKLSRELISSNQNITDWIENVIDWSEILVCKGCIEDKEKIEENMKYNDKLETVLFAENVKKNITLCCINILFIINEEMNKEIDSVRENVPEISIGANDKKIILTGLQLIKSIGFYLNLEEGVGSSINEMSSFRELLTEEKKHQNIDHRFLFVCVKTLCYLMQNKEFGQMITTNCLGDILGCLMQIGFANKRELSFQAEQKGKKMTQNSDGIKDMNDKVSTTDVCDHKKAWCKNELKRLLDCIYQPLIIRELLILQGFGKPKKKTGSVTGVPKWFQKRCSMLLTNKLMQSNGLKNTLTAVFEEYDLNGSEIIIRMDMIGYLVSSCPFQANSISEYYSLMSKQILKLINMVGIDEKTKFMYAQAVSSCISWMLKKDETLTTNLIIKPLFKIFNAISNTESGDIVISEVELSRSIENIHKIFMSKTTNQMVTALSSVSLPLFEVYILLRNGVSYLKSLVHDILVCILQNSSEDRSLELLLQFLFDEINGKLDSSDGKWKMNHLQFKNGENGGICIEKSTLSIESEVFPEQLHFSTEEKIDTIVVLLASLKESQVGGKFLLMLLKRLAKISEGNQNSSKDQLLSHFDDVILHLKQSIPAVAMVAAMCDKFGDKILHDKKEMMAFIKVSMERCLNYDDEKQSSDLKTEMLNTSLAILSLILNIKEKGEDHNELNDFISTLENIEKSVKVDSIVKSANDIRIAICTRGAIWNQHLKKTVKEFDAMSNAAYDTTMNDLVDPLLPTRAHAIVELSTLLKNRNPKAMANIEILTDIFMENLYHEDSYIYLASIRALMSVALNYHQFVIPRLAKEFAGLSDLAKGGRNGLTFNANCITGQKLSTEKRMKVGEALMKSIRSCGPVLPRYTQIILASLLTGVKDGDGNVRASSLSNIGETCKLLRFSVQSVINELLNCLSSILRFDKESIVKRAALSVIIMLLEGLNNDAFEAIGDHLKDIYQIVKFIIRTDNDDITLQYAGKALDQLEMITKNVIFPKQNFEKRINVLQAPDMLR